MAIPSVYQLQGELIGLVKSVPAFVNSGFSVFSLEDLQQKSTLQTLPVAGVGYDGAEPVGNTADSKETRSGSAVLVSLQYIIIVAVSYQYAGQDDTKSQAMDLLDQVRKKVLGYRGLNTRPWRFIVEKPDPQVSEDGLVFYYQVWRTELPVVGDFNNV